MPGENDGKRPEVLSDEVVEGVKKEVLLGTGYKRPPQAHQFKKGQSGNPKGRPKAAPLPTTSMDILLSEGNRKISVREGDKISSMSTIQAVVRSQFASAAKGNPYAQKHILQSFRQAEREQGAQLKENYDWWKDYCTERWKELAHAARNGLPTPKVLPHPDDVSFNADGPVTFIGPRDEESESMFHRTLLMRDVLIIEAELQLRDYGEVEHTTATVMARMLDRGLPKRQRLSEAELFCSIERGKLQSRERSSCDASCGTNGGRWG